jgi:TonB family protein
MTIRSSPSLSMNLPVSLGLHFLFGSLLLSIALHAPSHVMQTSSLTWIQFEKAEKSVKNAAPRAQSRGQVVRHSSLSPVPSPPIAARKSTEQAGISAQNQTAAVNTDGNATKSATFTEELRQALDQQKIYPAIARARKQSGRVEVGFTMMKTGKIVDSRVVSPCGYEKLNEAALLTVSRLGVFKPVPDEISKDAWKVIVPIDFRLN